MTTLAGIPAHALLVHAIVVLAPMTAGLGILCAIWPAARRRLVWLVLALSLGVLALTPLTTEAGEWLYAQSSTHSPILQTHAERGDWMKYFSIGLLVMAIAVAFLHVRSSRSESPKILATVIVTVIALAIGASVTYGVILIGHSGAEAVWG
ncbi:hypothetical protein JDV09_10460 [Mycobacterium sp. Y57]|uniref:DUF2231 domain-containing protein n=1 Tax=Mycolicibacterium xanthum TaxID=2796469 RepID=UPI001C8410C3|nr:DUF2231 domain-containing protein [Mycolicibacterium xanthum]MBX7432523.1 hypothetical protein [Mycolicibacterium xanthum]